jgi:hypothetical protein
LAALAEAPFSAPDFLEEVEESEDEEVVDVPLEESAGFEEVSFLDASR